MNWTRWFILLLSLALLAGAAGVASAQDDKAIYDQARADYRWLLKHPKAQTVYQNWQSLADRFSRVYTAAPKGPYAAGSLLWMGRIHGQAWRRFKRQTDFDQAVDLFKRLENRFPDSSLADDAQLMLAGLYEEAGQPKQAYLEYLRATVNYPRGDMAPRAKARLDALEESLAAGQRNQASGGPPPAAPLKKPAAAPAAKAKTAKSKTESDRALATVKGLRHWSTPSYTRVVIGLGRPVPYNSALLKRDPDHNKPRRLYLDLKGARLPSGFDDRVPIGDGLLKAARAAQYSKDTVRLVLDIKHLASYKVFTLDNPFRVVIDCFGEQAKAKAITRKNKRERRVPRGRAHETPPDLSLAKALGLGVKRVVVDAGHGGKDNGAMYKGMREKDLTLDLARRVAAKLKKMMGVEVLLTRDRDVYLDLEERTAFANTHDADLFVSIHVNAAASHRLRGMETYFLNLASDEESMRVAARENATTTRSISDLQVILNDLMLNSKINESNRLARSVHGDMLRRARSQAKIQDLKVKQAPFYVLIGARMPSILVEVGFMTNPTEHRLLAKKRYRDVVAQGIAEGIVRYAKELKRAGN
ncbi:MAG: N-acetylmuramoyl-L-alanine amidase [Desulfarculaceae bacterium]|nr:N-acetylmuramoyl-L-alanine amidase [Desulfarculaceae bacterium]MCF8071845.1 N-acetylmuramoyl-L-alanine amidase [Desulfarculaceae bacterium]MCF8101395.1 N-acetylmuramoyl-L-alanine amidase [Desulfarculaceae bacterium]MCF8117386.1 N-acetylmuramoyl-L-alanine amidase [Desulfarculaceae bacterium]